MYMVKCVRNDFILVNKLNSMNNATLLVLLILTFLTVPRFILVTWND